MSDETLHDRLPDEHFVETNHTYYARCSCGWVSSERGSRLDVDNYFEDHAQTHARKAERP